MNIFNLPRVLLTSTVFFCASASAIPPGANDQATSPFGLDSARSGKTPVSLSGLMPSATSASEKTGLSILFYPMVLVGLGGTAFFVMRSGWPARLLQKNAKRKLQVSEIRPLGNRQFLVVAEYESTRLLLGVSQGRIDLLCHLSRNSAENEDFAPLVQAELSKEKS